MNTLPISEQDYFEMQETVCAYAQEQNGSEDEALESLDLFLYEPITSPKICLFIWEAFIADELGLVKRNEQIQWYATYARENFIKLHKDYILN